MVVEQQLKNLNFGSMIQCIKTGIICGIAGQDTKSRLKK